MTSSRLDVDPLKDVLNAGRNLAPAAVGSQVLVMSMLSVSDGRFFATTPS